MLGFDKTRRRAWREESPEANLASITSFLEQVGIESSNWWTVTLTMRGSEAQEEIIARVLRLCMAALVFWG